jgi:hypothetical protein
MYVGIGLRIEFICVRMYVRRRLRALMHPPFVVVAFVVHNSQVISCWDQLDW